MVRSLSRLAAGLILAAGACGPLPALSETVSSASSLEICLERSAAAADVECVIDEPIVARTIGTATISPGPFSATLPTSRRLNITIRFQRPGCLIWNHQAAFPGTGEPANTTTPLRILDIEAPVGLVAGSRLRIENPCVEEWRNGAAGGSASTTVHGIVVRGAGLANLDSEIIDPSIQVASTRVGSRPVSGTKEPQTLYQSDPSTYQEIPGTQAFVTLPAPVPFGHSVATEASPAAFSANTYPG